MVSPMKAIELAKTYYSKKDFDHAMRVAGYSYAYDYASGDTYSFIVGILHDILENTDCSEEQLISCVGENLASTIHILTKSDDETYEEYIKSIFDSRDELAILVKRADMKDHLTQLDTLTDKLRDKYISVMKYFL